jgi:hypothetical protein
MQWLGGGAIGGAVGGAVAWRFMPHKASGKTLILDI